MGKGIYTYYKERLVEIGGKSKKDRLFLRCGLYKGRLRPSLRGTPCRGNPYTT